LGYMKERGGKGPGQLGSTEILAHGQ
jgi:hypothetical protein